ncbi:protein jagunal homolog 1 [Lingula anatina]|uniref:Protein jagunal homolog 1 n=1 Tax=Lingula anatina TaxID=7574 RepID=A0A1S3IT88_LINAN|nr:protein jagunal homolog 1 [Lingula anatina]|eukprot:XP_013401141.1 protein jagunal homolog 1 [Lingula anatina]
MSSRSGPRATGTDGRDFLHRETVAGHYKVSAVNKSRMKLIAVLHTALFMLWIGRLLPDLMGYLGMKAPASLMALPRASLWEFAWLPSILAALFAYLALQRNRSILMQQFILGTVLFGLLPIFYGIYDYSDDLSSFLNNKGKARKLFGFPFVTILYMFIAVALQVHGFGIYIATQLISSWKPKVQKKAN